MRKCLLSRRQILASIGGAASLTISPARAVDENIFITNTLAARLTAIDGASFTIEGRGTYRLTDVIAPDINRLADRPEPFSKQAGAILAQILSSGNLYLKPTVVGGQAADRWGRIYCHLAPAASPQSSVQEQLLSVGAVRVWPETDDDAWFDRLFAAEQEAQKTRRGLWALDYFAVRDADKTEYMTGAVRVVEGRVQKIGKASGRQFLNFGDDYRTDFTVSIRNTDARRWGKDGFEVDALMGARVRVRGFVEWINGPSVSLTHLRRLEVLG